MRQPFAARTSQNAAMPRLRFSPEIRRIFPPYNKAFDDYEKVLDSWEPRYLRAVEIAIEEHDKFNETQEYWARRLIGSQATNMAARIYRLAEALTLLLNDGNRHAIPAMVRPIIETAGVAAYTKRPLIPLLRKGRAEKAKVMLYRLGLGGDPGIPQVIRPIPVSSLIKAYAAEFAEVMHDPHSDDPLLGDRDVIESNVRLLYSAITDSTHPNGAAMEGSFARRDNGGGTWNLWMPPTEDDLEVIFFSGSLAVEAARPMWDAVVDAAEEFPLLLPNEDEFGVKHFPDDVVDVKARSETENPLQT